MTITNSQPVENTTSKDDTKDKFKDIEEAIQKAIDTESSKPESGTEKNIRHLPMK